jgi:hypothetical protein
MVPDYERRNQIRGLTEARLRELFARSATREDGWVSFLNAVRARDLVEIGVYRGEFAARLLRDCQAISTYYLVDPWRHLDDWEKPANQPDDVFQQLFQEALDGTSPYAEKRVVLRGRTSEVIDQIPDASLDFAYIDGDHTLRGITIDLVKVYAKIRDEGWIGGDDFRQSIWHHGELYEPTLVFPFAIYFAEAVDARIYGLPRSQFLIEKAKDHRFAFIDLTGKYNERSLRSQLASKLGLCAPGHRRRPSLGARLRERVGL